MYKLLLVTDREDVIEVFGHIDNWGQMMFHPVTIIQDVQEALSYLNAHSVDAIGYSIAHADVTALQQYITDHPSLPVFQTHQHDDMLHTELLRIRRFLDRMHADDSDEYYDEKVILQMLRDELMTQLLSGQIASEEELTSRIKLVRANASMTMACYLYDYDLPQGEVYLSDRWHYGRERLESALRNNFLGRFIEDVYYDVAVLTARHIRIFACPRFNTTRTNEEIQLSVEARINKVVEDVKNYLDLDLHLEQVTKLNNITALINYNS